MTSSATASKIMSLRRDRNAFIIVIITIVVVITKFQIVLSKRAPEYPNTETGRYRSVVFAWELLVVGLELAP